MNYLAMIRDRNPAVLVLILAMLAAGADITEYLGTTGGADRLMVGESSSTNVYQRH